MAMSKRLADRLSTFKTDNKFQEGAEAHGCLAPKEDPLDVLYPVDNKLDLPF